MEICSSCWVKTDMLCRILGCGGQTLRWSLWSLPPDIHDRVWCLPLICGQILWFASNQQNTAQRFRMSLLCFILYRIVSPILQGEFLSFLLALKKQAAMIRATVWWRPYGKELRVASRWQPERNWCFQSNNLQGTECCWQSHKLGSKSFPSQASDETAALTDTLTVACEPWIRGLSEDVPELLIYRIYDIINVCCFRLLNL